MTYHPLPPIHRHPIPFMGNCCRRLLYKFTKKTSIKKEEISKGSSNIQPTEEENWGDWDVEAPSENRTRTSFSNSTHQESVPFIHPNTIPTFLPKPKSQSPTARATKTGPLLKAKAGWVVRAKEKKKTNQTGVGLAAVQGYNQSPSADPFSSMGMTANYTDDRKIQIKKHSAVLGSGATSLEDNAFGEDDGGAWGEDDEDDI